MLLVPVEKGEEAAWTEGCATCGQPAAGCWFSCPHFSFSLLFCFSLLLKEANLPKGSSREWCWNSPSGGKILYMFPVHVSVGINGPDGCGVLWKVGGIEVASGGSQVCKQQTHEELLSGMIQAQPAVLKPLSYVGQEAQDWYQWGSPNSHAVSTRTVSAVGALLLLVLLGKGEQWLVLPRIQYTVGFFMFWRCAGREISVA